MTTATMTVAGAMLEMLDHQRTIADVADMIEQLGISVAERFEAQDVALKMFRNPKPQLLGALILEPREDFEARVAEWTRINDLRQESTQRAARFNESQEFRAARQNPAHIVM